MGRMKAGSTKYLTEEDLWSLPVRSLRLDCRHELTERSRTTRPKLWDLASRQTGPSVVKPSRRTRRLFLAARRFALA